MSETRQPVTGFVETNGTRLYYEMMGKGHPLEIPKAYLVGLSLGGMTAIDFTLEHPEMVAGLILVGSSITGFPIRELYSEEAPQREIQRRGPFIKAALV